MHFNVSAVFPHLISQCNLEINNKLILEKIKSFEYESIDNVEANLCEISKDKNVLDFFPILKKCIIESINYHIFEIAKFYKVEYKIYNSWLTRTKPRGYSHIHNHPNSWISAIYYPEDVDGGIEFVNSFNYHFQIGHDSDMFYCNNHSFRPNKNDLIIFPSYLNHKILKNESNKFRHSIALNIFPTGTFGFNDSQITLDILKK